MIIKIKAKTGHMENINVNLMVLMFDQLIVYP